jgi:protein TonB
VVVLFEIQRDGQVRDPLVEKSSGNNLYDQSALRAVMEASPFPPLPPEFKASSLRVHFGFEFQPGQG